MIQFLKKLIYRNIAITEYSGIKGTREAFEKVYLETAQGWLDVSQHHWVLCLDPIVFGVWLPKGSLPIGDEKRNRQLLFKDPVNTLARVKVILMNCIIEEEGTLILLKYEKGSIHHCKNLESRFLFFRYYRKPGLTYLKFKSLVTAYSYPRKVRIISFKEEDHFNMFPMDLLSPIPGCKRFVFGLRHTNRTLAKIIESKKILVSEIPFQHKEDIYKLGKHHSTAPPPPDQLPFPTTPSQSLGFPVPAWATSYREISILKSLDLGSHMLLWGETMHEEKLNEESPGLHHIHFLLYLHQTRKGLDYQLT